MNALLIAAMLFGAEPKNSAKPGLRTKSNIVFTTVDGVSLKLDIYRPDDERILPGVVMLYGGGWRTGNKESMKPAAEFIARQGYVVVASQYRLTPAARFPAQLHDAREAVRWLRRHADERQVNSDRIGAVGVSAGGHLALLLGLTNESDIATAAPSAKDAPSGRVQAVVNFFGPTDLTRTNVIPVVDGMMTDLVGKPRSQTAAYLAASPVHYIDKSDAPIVTLQGTEDPLVPYEHAMLFDQACNKAGLSHQLQTFKGAGHGWGGADLVKSQRITVDFLDRHLKAR